METLFDRPGHACGLIGGRRTWSHDSDFGFVDQDADGYVSIWQPGRIIPRGDSDSGLSKSPTGWSVGGSVIELRFQH